MQYESNNYEITIHDTTRSVFCAENLLQKPKQY